MNFFKNIFKTRTNKILFYPFVYLPEDIYAVNVCIIYIQEETFVPGSGIELQNPDFRFKYTKLDVIIVILRTSVVIITPFKILLWVMFIPLSRKAK